MDIKENNFDLLRLLAAIQVIFFHTKWHLDIKSPLLDTLGWPLQAFPGVPIFFMISGFLISASYEKSIDIKQYIRNRILRIFPGLWACFIVSIIIIYSLGYLHAQNLKDFFIWSLCQISFFQFYNPSFLRGFGCGVVNGSLWTIAIELQFYACVPILYVFLKKCGGNSAKFFWFLFILAVLFNIFFCNRITPQGHINTQKISFDYILLHRCIGATLLPHLYYFIIGILGRLYLYKIYQFVAGKFLYFFITYIALFAFFQHYFYFTHNPTTMNPIAIILLGSVIISFAFSFSDVSNRLLKGNDFSSGIYLYHMLIINIYIFFGLQHYWYLVPCVLGLAFLCAILSWQFIERPALCLKHRSLKKIANKTVININRDDEGPIMNNS